MKFGDKVRIYPSKASRPSAFYGIHEGKKGVVDYKSRKVVVITFGEEWMLRCQLKLPQDRAAIRPRWS